MENSVFEGILYNYITYTAVTQLKCALNLHLICIKKRVNRALYMELF